METLSICENVMPPKVCGENQFTLCMGFSEFDVALTEPLNSWFIRAKFWGFDDYVSISILRPDDPLPLQFSIPCALDDFFRYWQDGQYVYFELVDPALLEPVAFSYIDCQPFQECKDDTWKMKERITFYQMETGCVHSSASFVVQLSRIALS